MTPERVIADALAPYGSPDTVATAAREVLAALRDAEFHLVRRPQRTAESDGWSGFEVRRVVGMIDDQIFEERYEVTRAEVNASRGVVIDYVDRRLGDDYLRAIGQRLGLVQRP